MLIGFLPPLVLAMLTASVAVSVERFASPPGGLQLPRLNEALPDFSVRVGGPAYPRSAVDTDEVRVQLAHPPQRIVSQYWSIDEFLYSIVPPEKVVAVSKAALEPSVSNVLPEVQRFHPVIATDPERVLQLNPDLILISSSARADFTSLARSSGVPVYRMYTNFRTLEEVARTIRLVGYLTGDDATAAREETRFRAAIEEAKAMRPVGMPRPRILGMSGLYSYGTETLFDDMTKCLGAINVAAEAGLKSYSQINGEMIAKWNPEWIFLEADPRQMEAAKKRLLTDPAIAITQAARNDHIVVIPDRVFLPMSPFSTRLIETLATSLYGNSRPAGGHL